jgi:hypothetical protein
MHWNFQVSVLNKLFLTTVILNKYFGTRSKTMYHSVNKKYTESRATG